MENELKTPSRNFRSEKFVWSEFLAEWKTAFNDDVKIAEILNIFFSNAVNDLKIPGFHGAVPLADNISPPIFRAILKYANHPSTIAIKDLNNASMFSF